MAKLGIKPRNVYGSLCPTLSGQTSILDALTLHCHQLFTYPLPRLNWSPAPSTVSGTCNGAQDMSVEHVSKWEQSLDPPPHLLLAAS